MISKWKLFLLMLLAAVLAFFWQQPYMLFVKVVVVYLHEISHGIGALITGGRIIEMAVQWDESGFTKTQGGSFIVIASFGYLGSILWGSSMLYSSLTGKLTRFLSMLIGIVLISATFFFVRDSHSSFYFLALAWGLLLLFTPVLFPKLTRLLLFFLGGLTSMYAVYDLGDFFRGDILQTDAGIITTHYLGYGNAAVIGAYAIGISISMVSVWLVYLIILYSLHIPYEESEEDVLESQENFFGEYPDTENLQKLR